MTVYVVPCGLSALDQLGTKLPSGGTFARTIKQRAWLDGVNPDDGDAVVASWMNEVAAKAKKAGLAKADSKRLSAETHSLTTRVKTKPPAPGEHVLLLASDTKDGLSAAFLVSQYLTGADLTQITYVSSPRSADDPFELKVTQSPVTVIRIRGLKPANTDFDVAAIGIGRALRAATDTGETVEVHLTGGFKATLLHTLAMTEVLQSMVPGRVTAWNVFEDVTESSSDQPAGLGRIGLRSFRREYLHSMRDELSQIRKGGLSLGNRTFEDVCWTQAPDGSRRLNSFGFGYLAVLGEPSSALGDDNS